MEGNKTMIEAYSRSDWDYMRRHLPRTYERLRAKHVDNAKNKPEEPEKQVKITENDSRTSFDRPVHWNDCWSAIQLVTDAMRELEEEHAKLAATIEGFEIGRRHAAGRAIREALAEVSGLSWARLVSTSKLKEVVQARQAGMYLLRIHGKLSYPAIGRFFGNRDHTTAMHAITRVTDKPEIFEHIIKPIESVLKDLEP